MANPYPADFQDGGGNVRISGKVNFTDPNNQPGTGGSQPWLVAVAQLDNAQIKNLATTDIEILDPPGAGKAYLISSFDGVLDARNGAYVNPGGAELDLGFAGNWAEITAPIDATAATLQAITASVGTGTGEKWFYENLIGGAGQPIDIAQIANTAFCVGNIGGTDYTGGGAGNTLSVKVVYRIVDLTPFTS